MQSSEPSESNGAQAVSRSVFRKHRSLRRAFVEPSTGEGVADDGETLRVDANGPPSRLVEGLPADVEQVFLCRRPDAEGGLIGWLTDPALWKRWEDNGIHRDPERFVIRLKHRSGRNAAAARRPASERRRELTIYALSSWFAEGTHPRAARAAFTVLEELLRQRFYGARVLPTPAQTGLDLWDRRRSGAEYPVLPNDLRELIRSSSGQGRIQLCPEPGLEELPGFYYYDARFAYAAQVLRMPVGEPRADEEPTHDPYRPGRYEIAFRVPDEWNHLGLFAVKGEERDPVTGEKQWLYPEEPGSTWRTWADHSELRLAERFGWSYEIKRRILFDQPGRDGAPPEPLKAWRDNLEEVRRKAQQLAEEGAIPRELAGLVVGAVRSILLQAIGSFHRSGREVYHVLPAKDLSKVPPEYEATIEDHGKVITYRRRAPLSGEALTHAHPEWSSTIWAKTRANMLYFQTSQMQREGLPPAGVLNLPREDVLAIRTDALYLTRPAPWVDRGRTGEIRLKGHIPHPVPVPHSQRELNRLRDRAETGPGIEDIEEGA